MRTLPPRNWTLRVRLTALYGGVFLLAGTLLLGITYVLVQQRMERQAETYGMRRGNLVAERLPRALTDQTVTLGNGQTVKLGQLAETFTAAQDQYREDALTSLVTQGAVALFGVTVLTVLLCWLLTGRGLRPVHRITETARRIADSAGRGLHERIALTGPPDEIKQLADTFDTMLERLDRSFDGQRRFIAGASHEMRTPLAINRALIEVAVTRPGASPDVRELGETLLQVNGRHQHLIDGLLTLADSENGLAERHRVDLADLVRGVLAEADGPAREAGVDVRPPQLAAAPTVGDPYLLERLAQNLVENAIRHNVRDGRLTARTWSAGGRSLLEVGNTGPLVQPYETETIFEPFRRLGDRSRSARPGKDGGFGLGLSIVRAIARAHGGRVHAEARPGGGLTITVSLPAPGG